MPYAPQVSIVIPLFNDEDFVVGALDSCLQQSLTDIEIICVDDASTDGTLSIVEEYSAREPRIHIIRQPANLSAFQARRAGIEAATAPYVLFLDGDDEIEPHAAKTALDTAAATGADVVGFGVTIVAANTGVPRRFEAALQPKHRELHAPRIVPSIFPPGEVANGHLWRYLFSTSLLRSAYAALPKDATFYRANDLPITFLALAHARKYASTAERLYRYNFQRGTSGHAIDGVEHFEFLLSGLEPITQIADEVERVAARTNAPALIVDSYRSARLHIIGNILRYWIRDTSGDLQRTCHDLLNAKAGALDVVRAAAAFCPDALPALSRHVGEPHEPSRPVQSVLLTTSNLDTGGLQSVLLEQAAHLAEAGLKVTIATSRKTSRDVKLPAGVTYVQIAGRDTLDRIDQWVAICREHAVDVVIDHHILYNENWPWFALSALAAGTPTIGWIHNFALRPIFDHSQRTTFLSLHMRALLRVVTLSPTDVAFWKLRGIERSVFLPNPLSPLATKALAVGHERTLTDRPIELAWWGRLDRRTKQVHHLVEVAALLRAHGLDFRFTIIGPDSRNFSGAKVRELAVERGVADAIRLIGEQDADELLDTLESTDLLVSTSAIEGFQLTIIEAQALGMPVVMYDLPWLTNVHDNDGLVATPPGEMLALANEIVSLARDPERYAQMSRAARSFALRAEAIDVQALTLDLLNGTLASEYSPDVTLENAHVLVEWLVRIAERNIRASKNTSARAAASAAGAQDLDGIRRERDRARRERDSLRAELRHVTEGPSFRVGRVITSIPRKLRGVPRRLRDDVLPTVRKLASDASLPKALGTTMKRSTPSTAGTPARVRREGGGMPDVTFVIPVYNSEAWISECLSSILAQTGVTLEVICIDDGSTDASARIIRQHAASDARVKLFSQENSGQSVGRNRGLDSAAGRYLIYLDSDDYWPSDVLSALVKRADDDALDLLLFDCVAFRDGEIDETVWKRYENYYQRKHDYRAVRTGAELMIAMRRNKDYRPHVGLYLARTEFVKQSGVRFIPGIVHQDNPYTFRLLMNARRVSHERVDAYARRLRPGSTITTLTPERSAKGYFLSYLEMSRELARWALPTDGADVIRNVVEGTFDGAKKQFALISADTAMEIGALDVADDAQQVLRSLSPHLEAH